MDENQLLSSISNKLSVLIALEVQRSSADTSKSDLIAVLESQGLTNSEIASAMHMKPSAVAMARSRMKNKEGKNDNEQ